MIRVVAACNNNISSGPRRVCSCFILFFNLKQSRENCFIMALIFATGVPESASLPVLQHQICNFRIKRRMSLIETTHVALLRLTMSATIHGIYPEITNITSACSENGTA